MQLWPKRKTRVLVFGTGAGGVSFYQQQSGNYNVIGFLDNNKQKQGQRLFGKTIYSPTALPDLNYEKILIASDYYLEIFEQLVSGFSIDESLISVFHPAAYTPWRNRVSQTFRRVIYDRICKTSGVLSDFLFHRAFGKHSDVRRLRLTWLDQSDAYKVHVFRQAMPGSVQPPRIIGADTPPAPIIIPEVALYRFKQGTVYSISKSVQLPTQDFILERVPTTHEPSADYSSGPLLHHANDFALVRRSESPEHLAKGIIINGGSELNYYHWVAEVLTQLQFTHELPQPFQDYPLLISERSQRIPSIKSLLECLVGKHEIIYLKSTTAYEVDDLLMISAAVNLVPNYRGPVIGDVENSFARPESIQYLRAQTIHLKSEASLMNPPSRVFMARKNFLRRYNQTEILAVLEENGFTPVYMDELSLADQIATMANAELILGPTGAAWTNLLFASPGTKALCWMPQEFGQTASFSNLAYINGVEMDYITYPAGTSSSRELYYHDYTLDLKPILEWVASKTSNPA